MSDELFAAESRLERLRIPDAEVFFLRFLPLSLEPEELLKQLIEKVPWRSDDVVIWGKRLHQPRLTAWYGDPGATYRYSGIELNPLPWIEELRSTKERVEAAVGSQFNSVLLNYYRDHRDSMGFHSDDEDELGARPVIASLSLGAERRFDMKHKIEKRRTVHIRLPSGSLLLMKGDTQKNWKHGINKETQPCGPRINLTFRRIFANSRN